MSLPTKEQLEVFEKAKLKCPFCGEWASGQFTGESKDALYFGCCDRVLVCNDLGLYEETAEECDED